MFYLTLTSDNIPDAVAVDLFDARMFQNRNSEIIFKMIYVFLNDIYQPHIDNDCYMTSLDVMGPLKIKCETLYYENIIFIIYLCFLCRIQFIITGGQRQKGVNRSTGFPELVNIQIYQNITDGH